MFGKKDKITPEPEKHECNSNLIDQLLLRIIHLENKFITHAHTHPSRTNEPSPYSAMIYKEND